MESFANLEACQILLAVYGLQERSVGLVVHAVAVFDDIVDRVAGLHNVGHDGVDHGVTGGNGIDRQQQGLTDSQLIEVDILVELFNERGVGLVIEVATLVKADNSVTGLDGVADQVDSSVKNVIKYITPFDVNSTDEVTAKFVTNYKAAYDGKVPDQFAADGYDAIYTIAEALKQAGITDTTAADLNEKLIAAMTQITVDGVTGSMTWTADGEPAKSATAVVITLGTAEDGSTTASYSAYNK